MGLDTSHDAWHGSYSSFHKWRKIIANRAGYPPLDSMVGFGGTQDWATAPGDRRLYPLINHSDCDGEISPLHCARIAEGLEALIPSLAYDNASVEDAWVYRATITFRDGCLRAAAANEPLDFH